MNQSNARDLGEQRFVEELLGPRQRFVDVAADDVQFGDRAFARLKLNMDRTLPGWAWAPAGTSTRSSSIRARRRLPCTSISAFAVVQHLHDALEAEPAYRDAVPDDRRLAESVRHADWLPRRGCGPGS